jgi:hypothetical protein
MTLALIILQQSHMLHHDVALRQHRLSRCYSVHIQIKLIGAQHFSIISPRRDLMILIHSSSLGCGL